MLPVKLLRGGFKGSGSRVKGNGIREIGYRFAMKRYRHLED